MYYFYLPSGLFPATKFYVEMIQKALLARGECIKQVAKISDIPSGAKIVTINDKDFYIAYKLKRPRLTINWFQGITPEEIDLMFKEKWYRKIKVAGRTYTEKFAITHSDFNIFVSEEMVKHYRDKYGYIGNNYTVIPCFNSYYQENVFSQERYKKPSFVYAGNLDAWQCFERTVIIFKKIKGLLPDASLSVFTYQQEKAGQILKKNKVEANICCLPVDKLNQELQKYKYGFIVRDDIPVNHVATPTKLCNYVSSGLIPVFSNSLRTYSSNEMISDNNAIVFSSDEECVEKILKMESTQVKPENIRHKSLDLFRRIWNEELYVQRLTEILP